MVEQVIDASVAIKWVVKGEPFRNKARQLLHDARLNDITLIGPPLLEYELESVLQYRLLRHCKKITSCFNISDVVNSRDCSLRKTVN